MCHHVNNLSCSIFLKDIKSKKIDRFDHNFKRHPKKKRPKKREMCKELQKIDISIANL